MNKGLINRIQSVPIQGYYIKVAVVIENRYTCSTREEEKNRIYIQTMSQTQGNSHVPQEAEKHHQLPFDIQHSFQNLTPDDLGKLLDLNDELDLDLPDNIFGPDGQVFLDMDFNDDPEMKPPPQQQPNTEVSAAPSGSVADAARSVLASLDSTVPQEVSNLHQCHSAPVLQGQNMPCYSNSTQNHGAMSSQPQMCSQPQMQYPMNTMPGSFYIDSNTGNIIQVGNGSWQPINQSNMPQMFMPGMQYPIQYVVQHQQLPSMSYGNMPAAGGSTQNSPRKSPGKRRRQRNSTETVSQRSARAESGYTYECVTSGLVYLMTEYMVSLTRYLLIFISLFVQSFNG